VPIDTEDAKANFVCYVNSALFLLSLYQYLVTALAFSITKPFRKALHNNKPFSIAFLALIAMAAFINFTQAPWALKVFNLMPPEDNPENFEPIPRSY